ncbi:MAG: hypothetical protein HY918_01175 [Candidatus Doudnabacteria bacterium]|nr:hypothetical protein [Candidatus Doudnabacteria bacterium]
MSINGYGVKDPNYILRFSVIVFMGVAAMGSVLAWRSSLLFASEYQEMPITHEQIKIKKENEKKQQSLQKKILNNYKLEE